MFVAFWTLMPDVVREKVRPCVPCSVVVTSSFALFQNRIAVAEPTRMRPWAPTPQGISSVVPHETTDFLDAVLSNEDTDYYFVHSVVVVPFVSFCRLMLLEVKLR